MSNSANEQALIMQKKLSAKCLLVKPVAWNTTQVHANKAIIPAQSAVMRPSCKNNTGIAK